MRISRIGRVWTGILIAIAAFVVGGDEVGKAMSHVISSGAEWVGLAKGVGFILVGVLAVVGAVAYARPKRVRPAKPQPTPSHEAGRKVVEGWLKDLDKFASEHVSPDAPKDENWGPDNPKPQTVDWDDGKCPYRRDSSKPLGSRENPVVVGEPEHSTHLVFSGDRKCWILTDGLGNGWIR